MDTSDPDIEFDRNGFCNHCTGYFEKTSKRVFKGELAVKKLNALVNKIKKAGKGHDYDCIIGLSGGIDSSYTAYCAKKLGLRALTVHMDNGWDSELSVKNIRYIIDKLGFEYQSYVLDWEEFKDLQLAFLKASVPEIETPTDHAIQATLYKIASKYKIRYIISGGNAVTEGILPRRWHYDSLDITYMNAIHKKFGSGAFAVVAVAA